MNSKINKEVIVKMYQSGKTTGEIAKVFLVSTETINKIIYREKGLSKVKRRLYSLNEDYFSSIDTEAKAYFLGFIMADGCVYKKNIQILIQDQDREILEKFKEELGFTGNLSVYNCSIGAKNRKTQVRMKFYSHKMSEDLAKFGIVSRKTYLELAIPKIGEELISHFIRGFLDGDGWITHTLVDGRGAKRELGFCGLSKNLMLEIQAWFETNNVSLNLRFQDSKNHRVYRVVTARQSEIVKAVNLLYTGASIYLKRKQLKGLYCKLIPREVRTLISLTPVTRSGEPLN